MNKQTDINRLQKCFWTGLSHCWEFFLHCISNSWLVSSGIRYCIIHIIQVRKWVWKEPWLWLLKATLSKHDPPSLIIKVSWQSVPLPNFDHTFNLLFDMHFLVVTSSMYSGATTRLVSLKQKWCINWRNKIFMSDQHPWIEGRESSLGRI